MPWGADQPVDPVELAQATGDYTGLHGDAFLRTIRPDIANQVKALAEGRMQFPSSFALKTPYWQNMLQAVSQYDPSFDAVNYNARYYTRKDFTSGQSARNITSFNTVMGHLGTLAKAADALKNWKLPVANTVKNWFESELGDPRLKNFNLAKQAVAEELTRAFRGTGGTLDEVNSWKAAVDSSGSPDQLHAVINQALDLLKSRIDALGEQYNRGMGTTADPLLLLDPHAQAVYRELRGKDLPTAEEPPPIRGAQKAPDGKWYVPDPQRPGQYLRVDQ